LVQEAIKETGAQISVNAVIVGINGKIPKEVALV
jgi:hypothetical protein